VRLIDASGTIVWSRAIDGFTPVLMHGLSNGVRFESPPSGYHRVISLHVVGRDLLVAQTGLEDPRRQDVQYAAIQTFLYRKSDGRLLARQQDIPFIRAVRDGSLVVSYETEEGWELRLTRFRVER
jgi:hypothetical protein